LCLGQNVFAEQQTPEKSPFSQISTRVQGQVVYSNQSVVAHAAIFIADSKLDSLFDSKAKASGATGLNSRKSSNSTFEYQKLAACEKPKIPVLSYTCSDEQGHFALALPSVPSLPLVITIAKDAMTINISLGLDDLSGDIGTIALDAALLEESLDRVAIVDNISAFVKSGLKKKNSQLQANGEVSMDSEFLTAYGLDIMQSNIEYPGFSGLFRDADNDGRLDIFNYSTVLLKTSWKVGLSQIDAEKRQVLLEYVEKGGQLLITNKPQQHQQSNIEGFI